MQGIQVTVETIGEPRSTSTATKKELSSKPDLFALVPTSRDEKCWRGITEFAQRGSTSNETLLERLDKLESTTSAILLRVAVTQKQLAETQKQLTHFSLALNLLVCHNPENKRALQVGIRVC